MSLSNYALFEKITGQEVISKHYISSCFTGSSKDS